MVFALSNCVLGDNWALAKTAAAAEEKRREEKRHFE